VSARIALTAGLLTLSAACVSGTSRRAAAGPVPLPPSAAALDPSYDWHGLILTPFGTLLKESPVPLHEVLLFHDEAHPATEAEMRDCFAIDGAPPRFVGRQPDQLLLCFDHDRLNRVEASVRLGAEEAAQVFAQACALWLKGPAPPAGGSTCEGRDGGVAFSAQLATVPGEAVPLSITLSDVASRDPSHVP
jgi:hypothetical protein